MFEFCNFISICNGNFSGSKVRTVTLQMAIAVLKELVLCDEGKTSYMCDHHLAFVEVAIIDKNHL